MKNISLAFWVLIFVSVNIFSQIKISKQSVQDDLSYLFETLDKSAYNLYSVTSKEVFTSEYQRIINSLEDSLTLLQVNRLFQSFTALANDSHCLIDLPISLYGHYLQNGGTLFPLNLYFKNNKVLVLNNYSSDSSITRSDEVLSINGKQINDVMSGIYKYLSGENVYTKNAKIEAISFPRLFWIVYGESKQFDVKILKPDENPAIYKLNSIACMQFENLMSKAKPIPFSSQSRSFSFIDDIAYLTPDPFYNVNKKGKGQIEINSDILDNKEFIQFIDSCFCVINKNGTSNLILDLRGNPGGSATFSNPLIAYFASRPFIGADKFYARTSEISKKFWREVNDTSKLVNDIKYEILNRENGSRFELDGEKYLYPPQNDSLRYIGNVYVLINRFCGSQGIEVPAMIQKYGFGKLVGEITPPLISANARQFQLPNTNITVTFPEASYGESYMKDGIIPDYKIEDDVLTDKDEILEYTLKLIRGRSVE